MSTIEAAANPPTGPLAGVRILDLTTVVFGAYATQLLGDQGADVVKVENPSPGSAGGGGGDIMRWIGRVPKDTPRDLGPIFLALNRNKRSARLDLKDKASRPLIEALVKSCDVFVTTIRLASLQRLGLTYEQIKALRPDVVYVHGVGYGSDGPYGGEPAYEDLIQAASGLTDLLTRADGEPTPRALPTLVADKVSGLFMSQAITAGLLHRERTGVGQFIEVPMFECAASFTLVEHLHEQTYSPPTGPWSYPGATGAHRNPHPTKDGYVSLTLYSDKQWRQFFAAAGVSGTPGADRFSDAAKRQMHFNELHAVLDELIQTKTSQEWLDLLKPLSIPVVKRTRLDDLPDDPHLQAVNFFQAAEHPHSGPYRAVKPPVKFSGSPSSLRRHAPRLGEHTEELRAELGRPAACPPADADPHGFS